MRLITLLAGYAAGLAVAMKYRKNTGTSKLQSTDTTKSWFDAFVEEVVDIHKSVFADVRGLVEDTFEDVQSFDDLQNKVTTIVKDFTPALETRIQSVKAAGTTKKAELIKAAQDFYASHEATLERAKVRAASFSGVSPETIDSWINTAHSEIKSTYEQIQAKFVSPTTPKSSPTKEKGVNKKPDQSTPPV